MRVERGNAFDLLRAFEGRGERFDVVVLDPPALAKRGGPQGLAAAARAYKELVLRGARLTRAGGLLVACSCSGRVTRAQWDDICADAISDAGRAAHVLDPRRRRPRSPRAGRRPRDQPPQGLDVPNAVA